MNTRYRNVYVLAPYAHATGGVELGHQLVDYINSHEGNAFMVYEKDGEIVKDATVTERYSAYNIKVASVIEDASENMLVLPEVYFDWMYRYTAIHAGLWWMSVDNHFKSSHWSDSLRHCKGWRQKLQMTHYNLKCHRLNSLEDMRRESIRTYHFYQSAYAQHFLYSQGITRVLPLGDYINPEIYAQAEIADMAAERENLVLYNPAKGYEFTSRLIDANPDVQFIPLKGLTRTQLGDYMRRAKVYIDFGHFPGKDRLPREAVMNGLCIITGTDGAAGFYEDVAIDAAYKFKAKRKNIPAISATIRDIFSDFGKHTCRFDDYRRRIAGEKEQFGRDILNFFFMPDDGITV